MGCVAYSEFLPKRVGKGDNELKIAMSGVLTYLQKELKKDKGMSKDWYLTYTETLTLEEAFSYVKMRGATYSAFSTDYLFDDNDVFKDRMIRPDGGVIWLENKKLPLVKYPLLFSEMKTQGTNKAREAVGEDTQAVGNAIERLGKLTMFNLNLFEYDSVAPFVAFCSGCDFKFDAEGRPVDKDGRLMGGKLICLNGGFAPFNTVYTTKNIPKNKRILPSTIMAREEAFSVEEMFDILKEVGLDSFNNVRKNILKNSK